MDLKVVSKIVKASRKEQNRIQMCSIDEKFEDILERYGEHLGKHFPAEFLTYLNYRRNLRFEGPPDKFTCDEFSQILFYRSVCGARCLLSAT